MVSLGDKLESRKGIGPGFDFLRVILATSVVAWHCDPLLSGGAGRLDTTWMVWFLGYAILTMFFALSGLLIAGSALRHTPGNFLLNRGLRIFPALIVEVVLSAFILGPAFTSLTPWEYFSSATTWHYLTNVFGLVNFQLPGVFSSHPVDLVNLALWTIPYELACYVFMAVVMVTGFRRHPHIVFFCGVAVIVVGLVAVALAIPVEGPGFGHKVLSRIFTSYRSRVFIGFTTGVAMFVWRHRIPYSRSLLTCAILACVGIAALGPADQLSYPVVNLLAPPALVYLTAYVGVSDFPTLPVFHRGDYSYGIYLYGFPIQQVTVDLFPSIQHGYVLFALSFPVIVLFSIFSWHVIEKPVLRLRKQFSFVSRVRLADEGRPVQEKAGMPASAVARPGE